MTNDKYLTDAQAAEIMGLAVQTLRNWRCNRRGPKFFKIGRAVRYSQEAIQQFMDNNVVETQGKF
jgi:predicted DNA-binding transcriptional regulator AlpA